MIRSEALVDYEKFRSAKVAIFLDVSDANRSFGLVSRHGGMIERIAGFFAAKIFLIEEKKLSADLVVEDQIADAWLLLVAEGQNRALSTKKHPQRINVDSRSDWEAYAFKELIRQVKESTQILEKVTDYYRRFSAPEDKPPVPSRQLSAN